MIATFTGQQVVDAPTDFKYSCKVTTTGTDTSLASGQYQRFITAIEGYNMNHLNYGSSNAKTCTLSFYVKSSKLVRFMFSDLMRQLIVLLLLVTQ